uniref:Uncharacterized protein n=1 Tax=viral metagenome TaxID=1070528 RepID=A0A6C0D7I1_9ZZZZ
MNEYLLGVLFGGSLITGLGAISSYTVEKKEPTIKSLARDFIIGSVLFILIMQLLPESSSSLLAYLTGLFTFASFTSSQSDDIEIQVGIPKF